MTATSPPLNVQVAVLEQALDELDDLQATTSDLIRAYFNGDDDALSALLKSQAGDNPLTKAFNQQLIHQRGTIGCSHDTEVVVLDVVIGSELPNDGFDKGCVICL